MPTGKLLRRISENYDEYLSKSGFDLKSQVREGGGVTSGNMSQNDYENLILFDSELPIFHELPHRVLLHLPSLLTKLGASQITQDHYHFWAWTAEAFREVNRNRNLLEDDVDRLFRHVVDFGVGSLTSVPVTRRLHEENRQICELVSPHANRAMENSFRAATQLSHPMLEGLLRRLCHDYVELDGRVKSGMEIQKYGGGVETRRANNVGNLLHHYETEIADSELGSCLKAIRAEMRKYSTSNSAYEIITSWRHPHSHGGERFSGPEHVVLLNIICQLILGEIPKEDYKEFDTARYSRKILWDEYIRGVSTP